MGKVYNTLESLIYVLSRVPGYLCYADALDWLFMVLGTMGSFGHGMAPSISYYIVGKSHDTVGNNIGNLDVIVHELYKVAFYPEYCNVMIFITHYL